MNPHFQDRWLSWRLGPGQWPADGLPEGPGGPLVGDQRIKGERTDGQFRVRGQRRAPGELVCLGELQGQHLELGGDVGNRQRLDAVPANLGGHLDGGGRAQKGHQAVVRELNDEPPGFAAAQQGRDHRRDDLRVPVRVAFRDSGVAAGGIPGAVPVEHGGLQIQQVVGTRADRRRGGAQRRINVVAQVRAGDDPGTPCPLRGGPAAGGPAGELGQAITPAVVLGGYHGACVVRAEEARAHRWHDPVDGQGHRDRDVAERDRAKRRFRRERGQHQASRVRQVDEPGIGGHLTDGSGHRSDNRQSAVAEGEPPGPHGLLADHPELGRGLLVPGPAVQAADPDLVQHQIGAADPVCHAAGGDDPHTGIPSGRGCRHDLQLVVTAADQAGAQVRAQPCQLVNQLRGGYAAAAQNCDLHGRLLCLRELTHRA